MDEILNDPLRFWMLVILVATEIPAIIFLIVMWKKACKEAKMNQDRQKEEDHGRYNSEVSLQGMHLLRCLRSSHSHRTM